MRVKARLGRLLPLTSVEQQIPARIRNVVGEMIRCFRSRLKNPIIHHHICPTNHLLPTETATYSPMNYRTQTRNS